jgi:ketosteroid isomerase-like protein
MTKLLAFVLLFTLAGAAQEKAAKTDAKPAAKATASTIESRMDATWNAWCTMDRAKIEPFYDQTPTNVYFDLTPYEYKGFDAYYKGTAQAFAGATECKATISDKSVHRAGSLLWATAHVDFAYKQKGKQNDLKLRWTSLWEKKGGTWLIIHEHISAPIQ